MSLFPSYPHGKVRRMHQKSATCNEFDFHLDFSIDKEVQGSSVEKSGENGGSSKIFCKLLRLIDLFMIKNDLSVQGI